MIELFRLFGTQILKYGAIVGGVFLILFKARQSGKEAEQRKTAMEILKQAQESAKIDNYIFSIKPDALERLREKFNRD